MKKIKFIKLTKAKNKDKKYTAVFKVTKSNGDMAVIERSFGYNNPEDKNNDYTRHGDISRRNRYIIRHEKDLNTGDPTRAGFLSMFILWNKPTIKSSVADYNKRLKVYNDIGKFPYKDLIEEAVEMKKKEKEDKEKEKKE
jgi:hypothetical protein